MQGFSKVGASATVGDMMLAKLICCAGREGGQVGTGRVSLGLA